MIDTHELKKRDLYLNKIIAFQDTEPVMRQIQSFEIDGCSFERNRYY